MVRSGIAIDNVKLACRFVDNDCEVELPMLDNLFVVKITETNAYLINSSF